MTGFEFLNGQFQDISWLIEQTNLLYATKIIPKGGPTKLKATQDKVVALRKWAPSMPLIRSNLDRVFSEVDLFYVPKQMDPGPCIVFPQRDIYGAYARARVKPLYDLKIKDDIVKYAALGMKSSEFSGPGWIGNNSAMIERIIRTRSCAIVEGGFDLLAARLVAPDAPLLSSGTKTLGAMHLEWLRILGVRHLYLMQDNEEKGENKGGGVQSMHSMKRKIEGMEVEIMMCPSHDPSRCLENYTSARSLMTAFASLNSL